MRDIVFVRDGSNEHVCSDICKAQLLFLFHSKSTKALQSGLLPYGVNHTVVHFALLSHSVQALTLLLSHMKNTVSLVFKV